MNQMENNKEFELTAKETITGTGVYINALPEKYITSGI